MAGVVDRCWRVLLDWRRLGGRVVCWACLRPVCGVRRGRGRVALRACVGVLW